MAKVTLQESADRTGWQMVAFIERQLDSHDSASMLREALKDIAKTFAEKWVEENRDKIIERLNVDAIANMIMLEVANDIKKDARKEDDKDGRR